MLRLKEDFGAACDDSTVDDAPFAAFLAALTACGGEGVIEGKPLLSQAFAATFDKRIRLVGSGELRWVNPNGGLHLTMTTLDRFEIEGLGFVATDLCSASALRLTFPAIPSGTHKGPELKSLSFKGRDTAQHAWLKALVVENAWNARIVDTSTKGQDDATSPFAQASAIELKDCMAPELRGNNAYHVDQAIMTAGSRTEGLNIAGGELVGVRRGIVLPYATYATAGTAIGRLHINAYERCIVAEHVVQMHLHDMLLYKTHVSTSYWQGIEVNSGDSVVCHDVTLRGTPQTTGGNDCITFVNSTRCRMIECDAGDFGSVGAMAILAGTSASCRLVSRAQERGLNINPPISVATGAGNSIEIT